jgi:phosphohistidine phosphatase
MSMKKELILIRHTKSPQSLLGSDFDRPLKKDRIIDAENIGAELKKLKLQPDLIIASPALRTKQTAEIIAHKLKYDQEKIKYDIRLYESTAAEYLQVVQQTSEKIKSLIVVGHNPSITGFANMFLKSKVDEVPTTGVVWLEFESTNWDINETGCRLKHFLTPKTI